MPDVVNYPWAETLNEWRVAYVGHRNDSGVDSIFRDRGPLRRRLRSTGEQGGEAMIETIVLLTIVVLLLGYLVFALLRPEKF